MPAYQRVAEDIRQEIQRGQLKPGEQLRPNRALADERNVSLGTAQKAIRVLVNQGWLIATPAVGVFVNDEDSRNEPTPAEPATTATILGQIAGIKTVMGELAERITRLEDVVLPDETQHPPAR